ncbi:hypothetical protein CBR_g40365 [Chara braunii]|uniref:Retrotransposon gag domain-containing protein n=1 Tax=Chara braunii TaxID=69332 RepID=A0A388LTJ3_CHABU|nr:hypothetical protein CBR_g40365 [Chara braunii]|eukprot:GBG85636.1 hypothetical protein CBR_g40365 [Chara braunii]
MPEEMADGGRKLVTLVDLIDALDKRERAPSIVPKVDTFHFRGERVSDWLDLTEPALVGLSDEVKLQRVLRYVLHSHHQELGKVVDAANGSWARFRDMMQRKYRLGDGLLTMADLEAMNKDDFSMIGAFVHEFKRKARKVHGISEETQCAIFLGLLTGSEASELTGHGGGSEKLTWATIDKGVEEGSLDHVKFHRNTGSDLRGPSPTLPEGGEAVPLRTPLDRLEAHLDASQWGASELGADQSGPLRYEPVENEPEEESPEPRHEAGPRGPEEPQTEEVITVGDDNPPPTPLPEQVPQHWPEGIPEPGSEEIPISPLGATTLPPTRAGPEECERVKTPTTAVPQLTEPAGEHMDLEVPISREPPPEPPPAEEGTCERDPL